MTDTDTTITGEIAAAVRILRDISETLRSIDTSPICHDPHDYGQPLNPREGVQEPRGDDSTPTPDDDTGAGENSPQNATHEFHVGDRVVVSCDAGTMGGGYVFFRCETTGEITDGPDEDGDLEVTAHDSSGLLKEQRVAPKWLTPAPAEEEVQAVSLVLAENLDAGFCELDRVARAALVAARKVSGHPAPTMRRGYFGPEEES